MLKDRDGKYYKYCGTEQVFGSIESAIESAIKSAIKAASLDMIYYYPVLVEAERTTIYKEVAYTRHV